MKVNYYLYYSLLVLIMVIFSACGPLDPTYQNQTTISNDITQNTTWEGNKTYIVDKENLYIKASLRIEAGATIKLMPHCCIIVQKDGCIIAEGSNSEPIYFTSYKDDKHGGESNSDGDKTFPAAGDWGYINLNGTQNCSFEHCCFLYGGSESSNPCTIDVSSQAVAKFDNCTFAYNAGNQINNMYVGALNASNAGNQTQITNCTFYSNRLPLTINAELSINNSNNFSYDMKSNSMNGIYVSGENVKNNISWLENEVAFVICSIDLNIERGNSLTLGNNVVLKFTESSALTVQSGENYLINHDGEGVYFTSLKDDELKGDTNGDGSFTIPATGDWKGIMLENWKLTTGYANWDNILYNDPHAITK